MVKYEIIDTNTWIRKSQFDFFSTFLNPDYGFNKKIDVTTVLEYSKETKTSFFINFLYVFSLAMNDIPEMRLRYVNGEVRRYDSINPGYTVKTNDGSFNNCGHEFTRNYQEFYSRAHEQIEIHKEKVLTRENYNDNVLYNEFYATCVPIIDFEAMTHPLPLGDKNSLCVPRACWGKYVFIDGKYMMNLNITVSHMLVDGFPLAETFNLLQKYCYEFKELIKK